MKVRELVELLVKHADPDMEVYTQGCDCDGGTKGISIEGEEVLICRYVGDAQFVPPFSQGELEAAKLAEAEKQKADEEYEARERARRIERWGEEWQSILPD